MSDSMDTDADAAAPAARSAGLERITVGAKDAATMLGLSPRTLWTLTNAGEIPCIRFTATGSKKATKLYRIADLRAWAAAKAEEGRR